MTWSGASSGEHFVASNPPTGTIYDTGGWAYNVKAPAYGAKGLGRRTLFGASITSGQATLAVTDGFFDQSMVGWNVYVPLAGNANKDVLATTILSVQSATACTLNGNAGATANGGEAFFWPASGTGSDDAAAFNAALAANPGAGGTVLIPSVGESNFYPISALTAFVDMYLLGGNKRGVGLMHTGSGVFVQTGNRASIQSLTLFAGQNTMVIHRVLDGSDGNYIDYECDGSNAINTVSGMQLWNATLNSGGDYYNVFHEVNCKACQKGFDLGMNANATSIGNANVFVGCKGSSNRDVGFYFGYAEGNTFFGCSAEQNGKFGAGPSSGFMGVGLRFTTGGCKGTKWYGGWIEGNKNGTIRWDAAIDDLEITGVISQYTADGGGNGFIGFALGRNNLIIDSMGQNSTNIAYDTRAKVTAIKAMAYSASITPNAQDGEWQSITVTNGTAFTINAPTNPPSSTTNRQLKIEVINSSGGAMGVITWNAAFVFQALVWANPASTKKRFVIFDWNGVNWIATALATADY